MNLFLVRTWVDPYNERGEYRQSDTHAKDLHDAKLIVDRAERGLVLMERADESRLSWKEIYSKGF